MNIPRFTKSLCLIGLLLIVVGCLGCETCKGLGRDIKNADDWIRDNAW